MKKILKVCAASLLAVSSFSYSSPAPYQLSPLENYLIKSFAWEQYESFVNIISVRAHWLKTF